VSSSLVRVGGGVQAAPKVKATIPTRDGPFLADAQQQRDALV